MIGNEEMRERSKKVEDHRITDPDHYSVTCCIKKECKEEKWEKMKQRNRKEMWNEK